MDCVRGGYQSTLRSGNKETPNVFLEIFGEMIFCSLPFIYFQIIMQE